MPFICFNCLFSKLSDIPWSDPRAEFPEWNSWDRILAGQNPLDGFHLGYDTISPIDFKACNLFLHLSTGRTYGLASGRVIRLVNGWAEGWTSRLVFERKYGLVIWRANKRTSWMVGGWIDE